MNNKISYHSSYILNNELIDECKKIYDICCQRDNTINPFFIDDESEKSVLPVLYYGAYDGNTAGFISSYIIDSRNVEICVYVLPEYRRKGIATSLFHNFLDDYEEYSIQISIACNNTIAKAFLDDYEFEYASTECKMILNKASFKSTYQENLLRLISKEDNSSITYRAILSDSIIGSCRVFPSGNAAIIHDVEILETFRNKGYGYTLLTQVITELFDKYDTIILHVTKENLPAYNLYKKLGFHITEKLEYYYI